MAKTTTSWQVKQRYNDRVYGVVRASIPKETAEAFKAKCEKQNISQASVILTAIEQFLKEP